MISTLRQRTLCGTSTPEYLTRLAGKRGRVLNLEERFWSRVDKTETCWLWTAGKSSWGYGNFAVAKDKYKSAHVFAYELEHGPIQPVEGVRLTLDHLCRMPSCVRPSHLELVSNRENILRGTGFAAKYAVATHCKQGHEFTPANTGTRQRKEGGRFCRECRRIYNQATARKRLQIRRATRESLELL
jgi:hypothetical protein